MLFTPMPLLNFAHLLRSIPLLSFALPFPAAPILCVSLLLFTLLFLCQSPHFHSGQFHCSAVLCVSLLFSAFAKHLLAELTYTIAFLLAAVLHHCVPKPSEALPLLCKSLRFSAFLCLCWAVRLVAVPSLCLPMRSLATPLLRNPLHCLCFTLPFSALPSHCFSVQGPTVALRDLLPAEPTLTAVAPLADAGEPPIIQPFPHGLLVVVAQAHHGELARCACGDLL